MEEEWSYVGSIESDLMVGGLQNGIAAEREKQYTELRKAVKETLQRLEEEL